MTANMSLADAMSFSCRAKKRKRYKFGESRVCLSEPMTARTWRAGMGQVAAAGARHDCRRQGRDVWRGESELRQTRTHRWGKLSEEGTLKLVSPVLHFLRTEQRDRVAWVSRKAERRMGWRSVTRESLRRPLRRARREWDDGRRGSL